jgi:hypothetical protein
MLYQLVKLLTVLVGWGGRASRYVSTASQFSELINFPAERTPNGDGFPHCSTGYNRQ